MRVCYRFSTGITEAGKLFDTFVAALIVLNVVAVIAESEPFFGGGTGPSREGGFQEFFDSFEVRIQGGDVLSPPPCCSLLTPLLCSEGSRAGTQGGQLVTVF